MVYKNGQSVAVSQVLSVDSGVGQSMAGQTVSPTSDTTVVASEGAEIFNDYRERTYEPSGTVSSGNVASGLYSHAEGISTTASKNYSHAEGNSTTASGVSSHAEGSATVTSGVSSHAEGSSTTASGNYSHAEGYQTMASGTSSHVEGYQTMASKNYSHAEGNATTASGNYSHAEGKSTTASGTSSHAEGSSTTASGVSSHAEGIATVASGDSSHAEGRQTSASNHASHVSGKYNKQMTDGASYNTLVGDVFVVGNGTENANLSNALRLAYEGTLYLTKAYNSTGADYAEYFEWLDGNPDNEDRVGRFVTLEGKKIKIAEPGDYILGVISGQPCVIGNADEDWLGRWMHDDFNRFVKEYLVHNEVEATPPEGITDKDLMEWISANRVEMRNGHYFKIETEVVDYPTASWRHKANPAYDPSQPYIERKDRQEWDAVGMVGVLSVIDDGTCEVNGYAKPFINGMATKADSFESSKTYRVVERVNSNIVQIVKM